MQKAIFRFHKGLKEFLPKDKRRIKLEAEFKGKRSVKDMLEALGVPHTEIDIIVANGKSVDFKYILQDGDRISVYPAHEDLHLEPITHLQRVPLCKTKFIADINLGDIVRYMRALGFDVYFDPLLSSRNIIEISQKQNRIILTRSISLLKFKEIPYGLFLRHGTTAAQIRDVIDRLGIKDDAKPFSRCLRCNSMLKSVSKQEIIDRIPPKTKAFCDKYSYCKSCDKIYWEGNHVIKMKEMIGELLATPRS